MEVEVKEKVSCFHCGQTCEEEVLLLDDKSFCCYGCKTVFEILNENNLCEYYTFDKNPGINLRHVSDDTFAYLDEVTIRKELLEFDSPTFARVRFYVPNIHCISCIWLLENLQKLQTGVLKSEVNFSGKTVRIDFNPAHITLGNLAQLVASLGYAPRISLNKETRPVAPASQQLVIKLAIAGFAFGNIMLLSFPEYLGLNESDVALQRLFSWLNIALALPVAFYSGQEYFTNAWKSFKQRQINIDVPIAAGLLALLVRSVFDIVTNTGPGYLDSLAGLVFFLLIGRWFQSKTYDSLAFDRDYKSYFPLAIQRLTQNEWRSVIVYELEPRDIIRVRNMEIIPADSILKSEVAYFDYSFVTGESKPVKVTRGELVFAGGKLIGQPVELIVQKKTAQSQLTSLWNESAFQKPNESRYKKILDRVARRFTWIVLLLALGTGVFWYFYDASQMWLVLTSVLMVACPCALALTTPFTYGNMLRVFGRHGFYLKNADIIEKMASINAIVFDKTGTVTHGASAVTFKGVLSTQEAGWIKLIASTSTHPLSTLIAEHVVEKSDAVVTDLKEIPGKGIQAVVAGKCIRLGSAVFAGYITGGEITSRVFVSIDGLVRGFYEIETSIRPETRNLVARLGSMVKALLSGDQPMEETRMRTVFPTGIKLLFNQSPHDKLNYISDLQKQNHNVMMIGDGLNDAGALQQSDVGVAVTDDTGVFTPASDGILAGPMLGKLDSFLRLARKSTVILKTGFVISFFYNAVAISVAMSGFLTPLIAAVLMPISSISVVGFSSLAVTWVARREFKTRL
ncbi:MAG TPA: heavy metal translocating P-type ATPase metal-binding domain-containing protein [Cyclobacteriaceae bacterium]|jgi:Cu+-exporting ATPase|nr:heavy metal translocating P-type ATPase metal-binding domain-containing protein [Cytophagales bacterium]HRE66491.1 heavy metal translocating P-type ATPase metal-binding domain-containing protein [Cyclobacteriaceae bacterium]HRF31975.1 heavy metal translocating P-type ATPase metal-binding domain-containing protein [Cyclobacteriaceae bacterium]